MIESQGLIVVSLIGRFSMIKSQGLIVVSLSGSISIWSYLYLAISMCGQVVHIRIGQIGRIGRVNCIRQVSRICVGRLIALAELAASAGWTASTELVSCRIGRIFERRTCIIVCPSQLYLRKMNPYY